MQPPEFARIESWALGIVERVQRGQRVEDARIELKSDWPDADKTARRLAGHANAARGSEILWLIGVDESTGVTGANHVELANWWLKVCSAFDGLYPSLTDVQMSVAGKSVCALMFNTARAPFVTKNPAFGKPESGPISHEVPWREGTATRSALRNDLLSLLAPALATPDIDFLNGEMQIWKEQETISTPPTLHLDAQLAVYISPKTAGQVVIPFHRCAARVNGPSNSEQVRGLAVGAQVPYTTHPRIGPDSVTISATSSEIVVNGPGRCTVHASAKLGGVAPAWMVNEPVGLVIDLWPISGSNPMSLDLSASPSQGREHHVSFWTLARRV